MNRSLVRPMAGIALAISLVACTTVASPAPSPTFPPVRVSNQTSVAIALVVNGSSISTIAADGVADPVTVPFPARPWSIELRSPSGRTLVALSVPAGSITVGLHATSVNLACGLIELAVGDPLPAGGPIYSPGPDASPCA